jgi:tetratricopeptide (TPR) repeat protein
MVIVSDGEDLEGEVEAAVRRAKEAGVVVHAVGIGTEGGQPVPEVDAEGKVTGYKRDEQGGAVVSRLNAATLEAIASGTGGKAFRVTPADTSLSGLAAAIEGMEQKALAREYSYRRKERFQVPLAAGLASVALALLLPPPPLRRRARSASGATGRLAATLLLALLIGSPVRAQAPSGPASPAPARGVAGTAPRSGSVLDELLLRPRRATEEGRAEYARGSHPQALSAFERAAAARPLDPAVRFNVADGLYKNGRYDEAAALYKALGSDASSPVAAPARYNLGNTLFQKQDYKGAVQAYRDALRLAPGADDARRNLELALRALREQEEQQKRQQQQQQQDQKPPQSAQEKADQRFRQETGMPRERAMQLLDALQQNEKAEQRKLLAQKRAQRRKGKDW